MRSIGVKPGPEPAVLALLSPFEGHWSKWQMGDVSAPECVINRDRCITVNPVKTGIQAR